MRLWAGYLTACLAAAAATPVAAGQRVSKAPLRVVWTKGACLNCQSARELAGVEYSRGLEIWAIGYNPPGEAGAGDWTVLRSRDAGGSWREVRRSYSHNSASTASFTNARDGWIMAPNTRDAEAKIISTRDGGAHWANLAMSSYFVSAIAYLGSGVGYVHTFDIYSKKSALLFTINNGHSWRRTSLPKGFNGDAMKFADARHGMLVGCLNKQVTVLSTSNAARSWSTVALPTIASRDREAGCPASIDSLRLTKGGGAFLLARKRDFPTGDTTGFVGSWATSDFGKSWRSIFRSNFVESPAVFTEYDGPYLLGRTIILVEGRERDTAALYSRDGGKRWSRQSLWRPVSGCAPAGNSLRCTSTSRGGGFQLATITLQRP